MRKRFDRQLPARLLAEQPGVTVRVTLVKEPTLKALVEFSYDGQVHRASIFPNTEEWNWAIHYQPAARAA